VDVDMTQAGTLAEEATRLLGAVEAWWRDRAAAPTGGPTPAAGTAAGPFADHRAGAPRSGCEACPICQLLTAVRTARPEAFEHALDAAGSLLLALRSHLEAHDRAWAGGHRAPVQHIPIREGDE
jgi:hypothetical protein